MQAAIDTRTFNDRKVWFSMWFLGAVVTFGAVFFPMFHRLVEGRNYHFEKTAELEQKIADYHKIKGQQASPVHAAPKKRNAKLWAASIILVFPAFVLLYVLTHDLVLHERQEDDYLASVLPRRVFMTQTIPQTTYVLITILTLGVGGVYWLYKIVNLYNQHYKADLLVEKEIVQLMEEEGNVKHM
jgi:hypothetical protein